MGICSGCRVAVGEFGFWLGGYGENTGGTCFCVGGDERRQ